MESWVQFNTIKHLLAGWDDYHNDDDEKNVSDTNYHHHTSSDVFVIYPKQKIKNKNKKMFFK
jgi:hypothetical protein